MSCTDCCKKDEHENWITDPCCWHTGRCDAGETDSNISICECCGDEMHKEGGVWWHFSQMDMPIEERGTIHYGS